MSISLSSLKTKKQYIFAYTIHTDTAIYELDQVVIKVDKFQDLQSTSWSLRKVDDKLISMSPIWRFYGISSIPSRM